MIIFIVKEMDADPMAPEATVFISTSLKKCVAFVEGKAENYLFSIHEGEINKPVSEFKLVISC